MFKGQLQIVPEKTNNLGTLVQPPVSLDWDTLIEFNGEGLDPDFKKGWVVLFPMPEPCDAACFQKATTLRQVHRASGKDQDRISLVMLMSASDSKRVKQELFTIYPSFIPLIDPSGKAFATIASARLQAGLSEQSMTIYLVDPLGNIMMAYDNEEADVNLSKDLKRLLKWSKQDTGS
jgi:cytochrome oxidase Cu insertion factor (SCO1/SenC/PrrC family)